MSVAWRPQVRYDRQVATLWLGSVVGLLALRPLWLATAGLFPACAWHRWTGLPCPGCGSTRAFLRLLQGDAAGGFAFNPLAASVAVLFVALGLAAPVWLAAGGRIPVVESRFRPGWLAAVAVAVLANWAWLYASGV
jgi:hypothetical protein